MPGLRLGPGGPGTTGDPWRLRDADPVCLCTTPGQTSTALHRHSPGAAPSIILRWRQERRRTLVEGKVRRRRPRRSRARWYGPPRCPDPHANCHDAARASLEQRDGRREGEWRGKAARRRDHRGAQPELGDAGDERGRVTLSTRREGGTSGAVATQRARGGEQVAPDEAAPAPVARPRGSSGVASLRPPLLLRAREEEDGTEVDLRSKAEVLRAVRRGGGREGLPSYTRGARSSSWRSRRRRR